MSQTIRVGVFGAAGYAGLDLVELLVAHPQAELVFATSNTYTGDPVPGCDLHYILSEQASLTDVDVVFLALPHKASAPVAAQARSLGVRVLDLKVTPQADADRWRYDLVLIQSVRHDKRVAGRIRVVIAGSRDGKDTTEDLEALLTGDRRLPQFAFKYFQEFSGEFRLPAGFRPARMTVMLDIDGAEATVENPFDWSKIKADSSFPSASLDPAP